MEKVSKKMKNKLVKGKPFLNDFHKKSTKKALKANEYFRTLSLSWKDMNDQAKRVQPNGKHMQREY
ncbi:MAG TPA: hypothetical protein ENK91_15635 [Bacteroidetes bacterium]|jgi:hypothetical protein|nr:hypothetical protein [Bacteroidota bacterium]